MTDNYKRMAGSERRPSFERIPFRLRPTKSIERKMLCEAFQRLSAFEQLERYRYIGLGSPYFSDFGLFHRALGITDMINIEREVGVWERFEFNRPYRCIQMEFGESSAILPRLSWDVPTILWLDYDGILNHSMLSDMKHACANAPSGSVVTISVNAHPFYSTKKTLQRLTSRVGEDKVPIDVSRQDVVEWGLARVCRRIIVSEIDETLKQRNGGLGEGDRIRFKQLFNFHYRDNARMLTVGGLLYAERESAKVAKCAFEELSFFRGSKDSYLIEVPCLTYREIRHLDRELPCEDLEETTNWPDWLPTEDVKAYAQVYRYFPMFVEAEL